MEAQTLFDTVAKHLLDQGRRAMAANASNCAYRSEDGCKCAVGVLIPDDVYDKSMEGMGIARLVDILDELEMPQALAQFIKTELEPHLPLLMSLQSVHDGFAPEKWAERLRYVAAQFNLNLPEVLQ